MSHETPHLRGSQPDGWPLIGPAEPPGQTLHDKTHDGIRRFSYYKKVAPVNGSTIDRADDESQEVAGKTNHYAGLCFGAAVLFVGLSFYDGYRFFSERTVSLILSGIFWALVATIIGTAGEILQKTTGVETPIVPRTIYPTPAPLKKGQFPGMPNVGNTCFINAPTQAIMTDDVYPRVYKAICKRAKERHVSFKNFLELYPAQTGAQTGLLSSFAWPQIFSQNKVEPPLAVVDTREVLVMLMMRRSSLNYHSPEFQRKYPNIHRLIGEFSTITKDSDFPAVPDDKADLRKEFTLMKEDADILKFFDHERIRIADEISGFDAFLNLIQAYKAAVRQKLPVVSFGRWVSASIGNIRRLISGAGGTSQEDVEEFLHCLSKYVMPDDYPEVFFPLTYERVWEECPEAEQKQDAEKLQKLLEKHKKSRDFNDQLTPMPNNKTIVERSSPMGVLKIESLVSEEVDGQTLLNETFEARIDDHKKETHFYLNSAGLVRKYYLVSETISPPAKLPERIILELIRYKWVAGEHGRREKINCAVDMPEQIDICGQPYELKSVVLHSGSPDSGHYYTLVRKGSKWWYASDSTVYTAEEEDVRKAANNGCLYFYSKIALE